MTESHVPFTNFNYPINEKVLIVKKERPCVNDYEQDPSSSAADETGPRNIRSPASDDNPDYHFLMSLHYIS